MTQIVEIGWYVGDPPGNCSISQGSLFFVGGKVWEALDIPIYSGGKIFVTAELVESRCGCSLEA